MLSENILNTSEQAQKYMFFFTNQGFQQAKFSDIKVYRVIIAIII